ncbi:AAC(3) family N-acetyltransferase [Zoogloea sp.]|uniref:AAC(3) family N-acetyltransferase n=1 Tax=Zoogloea sp. TaxID=49181 RepID=UPI00262E981A|nr:AAC(3) family N-acetyltransferase [Zoogloea sp.]MDD3352549.1 AAC(3) family N-acetyltransferase [Zoogloea sp.]
MSRLTSLKQWVKSTAARTLWAYGADELIARLRQCGVVPGTTLVVHSSWLPHNGFQGKPADLVKALKLAVGDKGLLVMPSMPYHNMSSAQWLAKGKPMNVARSPSMMGLVSEVFRRSQGVRRSLSPTHPLLAWGQDAAEFIAGHEQADRPFGARSPFARMLERDALILGFDAPFASFTYTHFVEDQLEASLPCPLYEPVPVEGQVLDADGHLLRCPVRVLSAEANRLRREVRLVEHLKQAGVLREGKLGNTRLTWISATDHSHQSARFVAGGGHFFDAPPRT